MASAGHPGSTSRITRVLHGARTEPWTQVVARLLTPDGVLIGVCYTPWFHDDDD